MNWGKVGFDPGHYEGINAGPNGYYEGNVMLKLGLLLKQKGFYITREDGRDITLIERVRRAKAAGCDTLVSLHTDWIPPDSPKSTEGTMVIYSINKPGDKEPAEYIGREIAKALGTIFRGLYTRRSTTDPSKDYYGILRHSVNLGLRYAFIVEHCNHGQLAYDTDAKLKKIADCYERIFKGESKVFNDFDKVSSWAKDAVKKVKEAGIMVGDGEGNFNPQKPVTREELAVVISRILES